MWTRRGRHVAWLLSALGAALTVTLGIVFHGTRTASALDAAITSAITGSLGEGPLRALAVPTEPALLIPAVVTIAALASWRRRTDHALLAATAPALAVVANTVALKPLFARRSGDTLAYPSGHTVLLVSVLTVLLVVLTRTGTHRTPAHMSLAGAGALLVAVCGGVALVGLGYHYPTDVLGGAAFAVTTVLSLALLLDRCAHRGRAKPGGTSPAGTSSDTRPPPSPR